MAGKKPLIVLLGPTAVGKTDLAIALARALNGEIINADSRQVYRYMDIGTAKPTPEQQKQAAHHLLDMVTPEQNLSLAEYQQYAYRVIDDIHAHDAIPLLVGGSGQYISAVTEGWSIPAIEPNQALRTELEAQAQADGPYILHERLRQLDPISADNIHPHNVRRVVRALEVCIESGKPFSGLQGKAPPPYSLRLFGLTLERSLLYARADRRLDQMMRDGFPDEVRRLLDMGYDSKLPSMSGLGYRQLAAYLAGEMTEDEALALTKTATHDFIRKQYTWFHGHDQGIIWLDAETLETGKVVASVADWLKE